MSTHTHRTFPAVVALAATLLFGGLVHGGSAFAAYPGANGKIAYESTVTTDVEIFAMNPDGSGQTNLTNDPSTQTADDRDPSWSPDGSKIAFSRASEGHMNVYVMNADGSTRVNLTPGADTTGFANAGIEPTWSPDGTRIAYNHSGDIWVMDAASGAGKVRLEFGTPLETEPAWSPDGTRIAFMRGVDIWVGPATGGVPTQLTTTTAAAERSPDWAPDGSRIVYNRGGQIWVMSATGSGQTALTVGGDQGGTLPAWSPDGTKIVFDSTGFTAPNGYDIFLFNPDGTGVARLNTPVPGDDLDPSWQPIAATGGYPRPRGATPLRVAFVPAFKQCTTPNRSHGAPLAHPSCSPPVLESAHLTMGAPDANGAPVNASGFATYTAVVGAIGGPDDSDVRFEFQLTDVRLQGTLADYTGELQATTVARITDRLGGPLNEQGTVTDLEFPVRVPCTATGGTTSVGATCAASTSFDAVVPGVIPEGKRAIWQLDRVRVNDGGADGLVSTTPNTLFAVQGVFVP